MTLTFIQGHKCVSNLNTLYLAIFRTILTEAITFKLGMTADLRMPCVLMLVWMTLTLMQGHSGSANAQIKSVLLSATKQAISIKLATTTVGLLSYVAETLT